MSTFMLCPEPGISSFFRRMTAQLRVFFSRNNLSYYSRWYTNPAGNLSVRVCMFRRGGVWTPCLYYRQGMYRNEYTGWYQPLPREVIYLNRFTGRISRRRTWHAACRMAEQLTTLRYRFGLQGDGIVAQPC
ncbi:TPA: hypothetical protein ACHGD0_005564 [Escherichia coli]